MTTIDTLRKLLTDAAERSPIIETVLEDEATRFEFGLSEDRAILAEYDPTSGRLMFSTEIGRPSEARRGELLELLMSYNALWRETGGVRIASAGKDEPLVLMVDIFVFGFDADQIVELVGKFVDKAAVWSELVALPRPATFDPMSTDALSIRI